MIRFNQDNSDIVLLEEDKKLFMSIAERYEILYLYPAKKDIEIKLIYKIRKNTKLLGNTIWKYDYIDKIETPRDLPRVNHETISKNECLQFEVNFIDASSGGMSSWFGYSGYYLNIIIDLVTKDLLDVRGQNAF